MEIDFNSARPFEYAKPKLSDIIKTNLIVFGVNLVNIYLSIIGESSPSYVLVVYGISMLFSGFSIQAVSSHYKK